MNMLTERQQTIIEVVTRWHIKTGVPVSSKAVAEKSDLDVSPSTVRNEFAVLEELGYMTHPHTSAGRVPTDRGYRIFVDRVLDSPSGHEETKLPVAVDDLASEVDVALQHTSDVMSQATDLLALVVGPRLSGARLRHVELLLLGANLVMVVFIASTGHVTKHVVASPEPVDEGMVDWGRTYLNEIMENQYLTERLIRQVLDNPDLSVREREFLGRLAPAFTKLLDEQSAEALYVGGTSRLLSDSRLDDVAELRDLLELLEERFLLLRFLRSVLRREEVAVTIGGEHDATALKRFSVVSASYGLPQRSLGTVGIVGPIRMDYEMAISTVRSTAQLLSAFLEARYE